MCGLVAIYQPGSPDFDLSALRAMTGALAHRGPDDFGFAVSTPQSIVTWRDQPPPGPYAPGVAMGHRRLSILDLSEAGRQPFLSSCGRFALVYNGEVFNYRELRDELRHSGARFSTETDTEVVLAAFAQWGPRCFARFNGMWAIVVWDRQTNQLVASRDRFGVKPLYHLKTAQGWAFASEVKAFQADRRLAIKPNVPAFAAYLLDHGSPCDGETFYEQVQEVRPGTYMVLSPTSTSVERYWSVPSQPERAWRTLEEAAERLRELLQSAVALRMRSDVRVGTMLSGGLDSTSVISMVRRLMAGGGDVHRVTGDTLQAFTAVYPGTSLNEEPLIDELCTQLGVRANKVLPLDQGELVDLLQKSMWHMERPYFNSVPLVHTLLMRKARSEGVTVVLNGHGPDEMFAGYPASYIHEAIGDSIRKLHWGEAWRDATAMRDVHGMARKRVLRRALFERRGAQPASGSLSPEGFPLLEEGVARAVTQRHAPAFDAGSQGGLDRALREDFFRQSLPAWLHLEDRISMSESIEARLPFLDYRIVEFAFTLPNEYKIHRGETKRVLREAMRGQLPASIVSNSRKVPFSGPDAAWIRGPLRQWITQNFLDGRPRIFDHLQGPVVKELIRDFLDAPVPRAHQYRVWKIVSAELWLRSF